MYQTLFVPAWLLCRPSSPYFPNFPPCVLSLLSASQPRTSPRGCLSVSHINLSLKGYTFDWVSHIENCCKTPCKYTPVTTPQPLTLILMCHLAAGAVLLFRLGRALHLKHSGNTNALITQKSVKSPLLVPNAGLFTAHWRGGGESCHRPGACSHVVK